MAREGTKLAKGVPGADAFLRAFAPPPPLDEWARRHRIVVGGARPGPWQDANAPMALEPMRAISDPAVEMVSISSPVQLLKSEYVVNVALYAMWSSDAVLYYQPDIHLLRKFIADRIRPALLAMGAREIKGESRTGLKQRDSAVQLRAAGMGEVLGLTPDMRTGKSAHTARVVLLDEFDAMGQTDMLGVADARTTTFIGDRKIVVVSTPTLDAPGTIWQLTGEGSRGVYHGRCPHCGELASLDWSRVVFSKTEEGLWSTAWKDGGEPPPALHCEHCAAVWTEAERLGAVQEGGYIHEDPEHPHRSYRIPGPAHLWRTVPEMQRTGADAYRAAVEDHDWAPYIRWNNEVAARPWTDDYAGLSRSALSDARFDSGPMGTESMGQLPEGALFVTAGADLGASYVKSEWVGWGIDPAGRILSWGLLYRTYGGGPGDSIEDGELAEQWYQDVMRLRWRLPGGAGEDGAVGALIDAGYASDLVRSWCRSWQEREAVARGVQEYGLWDAVVLPCKGRALSWQGAALDFGGPDKQRRQLRAGQTPGQVLIDTGAVKEDQYDSLLRDRRLDVGQRANLTPAAPLRAALGYTDEWVREMTAEVKGTKRREGRRAEVQTVWTFRTGLVRKNHAWDCRIYARAAAMRYVLPVSLPDGLREMAQRARASATIHTLRPVEQ